MPVRSASPGDIPAEMKIPVDRYAWLAAAKIVAPIYLLLLAAYLLAAHTSYPALALIVLPFLGGQIHKITMIMHDCCHGTLFRDRKLNNFVGVAGGYFVGADFYTYRKLHWEHHACYGEGEDPQGDNYLGLENANRWQLTWHLFKPLIGFNLFRVIKSLIGPQALNGLLRRDARSEHENGKRAGKGRNLLATLGGILLVQSTIVATATGFGNVWWTALLYPVAAATFALFFAHVRGFAEHVNLPRQQAAGHARTHLPNWFDKLFLYGLNFNYHIEHHAHPSVPSCYLPRIHETMREEKELPDLSESMMGTIIRRFRATSEA
jgi:fatty acid desaturase